MARCVRLLSFAVACWLASSPAAADPFSIFVTGRGKPETKTGVVVSDRSTGTDCVHSKVGDVRNQFSIPGLGPCTITIKSKTGGTSVGMGIGATKPKFMANGTGGVVPQKDNASSVTLIGGAFVENDLAGAFAEWESFVGVQSYRSELVIHADVRSALKPVTNASASAQARDPFEFDFLSPGTLDFNFIVGGSPVVANGITTSALSLFSNDPDGIAHLDFNAGFTNVNYGGSSLDGDLFLLSIDAKGIITSPSDLIIGFQPWSDLGMNDSQVEAFISYFRSNLISLSDRSVGLPFGMEIALIGPGSPIGTLTFNTDGGVVTNSDSVAGAVDVTAIPEPATGVLLFAGIIVALARRRVA